MKIVLLVVAIASTYITVQTAVVELFVQNAKPLDQHGFYFWLLMQGTLALLCLFRLLWNSLIYSADT